MYLVPPFSKRVNLGALPLFLLVRLLSAHTDLLPFCLVNTRFVLITEVCPVLPDTFIAELFLGLTRNHVENISARTFKETQSGPACYSLVCENSQNSVEQLCPGLAHSKKCC